MMRPLNYYWRLAGTGFSFASFGIGGLVLGLLLFPAIHALSSGRDVARLRCQYCVHLSFRFFIWMMKSLGVLSYEIAGRQKLARPGANFVVANHPSLIDIVFIISLLPQALCVVKKAAWSNPFMAGIMWATGYIPNDDGPVLIDACVRALQEGKRLVVFPEGTRTVPGLPMKLKRGAATIIVQSEQPFLPVTISCAPTTLTKAERWYQIPTKKPHFRIQINDSIDVSPDLTEGERLSKANRRVSRVLQEALSNGV
jgi:1-acyl-sn-glycerol-3-phosphate acyltransferase